MRNGLSLLLLPMIMVGCAVKSSKSMVLSEDSRLDQQAQLILKQKKEIQDLKEETIFLRQLVGVESKSRLGSLQLKSEKFLFSQIEKKYQDRDEKGLKQTIDLLLKLYPKSSLADDALYLSAKLASEQRRYGLSIQLYDEVIRKYPKADRVPSSWLGKALDYEMLNLKKQSQSLYKEIIKKYPSTPEATQARSELKRLTIKK